MFRKKRAPRIAFALIIQRIKAEFPRKMRWPKVAKISQAKKKRHIINGLKWPAFGQKFRKLAKSRPIGQKIGQTSLLRRKQGERPKNISGTTHAIRKARYSAAVVDANQLWWCKCDTRVMGLDKESDKATCAKFAAATPALTNVPNQKDESNFITGALEMKDT